VEVSILWKGNIYEEIYRKFKWEFPEYYNIGVDICDKCANDKYRVALIYIDQDEQELKVTYWELRNLSNRFANALRGNGI